MRGRTYSLLLLTLVLTTAFARPVYTLSGSTNPSTVYAGDSGYVSVVMTNSGTEAVDNVKINVTSKSSELNITQTGFRVFRMEGGDHATASFPFKVKENVPKGVYFVDFSISFDGYGSEESTYRVFVTVDEDTNLIYTLDSGSELLTGNNTVKVTLENPYDHNIGNLLVKLEGNDPFSILNSERFVSNIDPFSKQSFEFEVWLDDVSEGVYPLTLVREYSGLQKNATLNFRVHGKPDLTYEVVGDYLLSGNGNYIELLIRNTGLVAADDVKVTLAGEDPISINNPEQYFLSIPANDSIKVVYNYSVSTDAEPGIYPLTLDLDYESSESHELQFEVVGKPDLEIAGVNTDPERIYANSEFTVSVQVENVGNGKSRNVKAYLTPSDDQITGLTEFFIGPIEADDIDSAVFDLIIGNLPEGPNDLMFKITYSDLDGLEYVLEESLRIYVRRQADYTFVTVIVIVVLAVIGFYYRKKIIDFVKNLGKMI